MLSAPPGPIEGHANPQVSAVFALDPRDAEDAVLTAEDREKIADCLGCNEFGLTLALDGQPVRCLHVTKPTVPIPTPRPRKRRSRKVKR